MTLAGRGLNLLSDCGDKLVNMLVNADDHRNFETKHGALQPNPWL